MEVDAVDASAGTDAMEQQRTEAVEAITGAADQLLTRGQTNIYDDTREMLIRQYARETGADWLAPVRERDGQQEREMWEYRWTDARDGGEAHGPYDGAMMNAWIDAGFFGGGVEYRRLGDKGNWSQSVDFI